MHRLNKYDLELLNNITNILSREYCTTKENCYQCNLRDNRMRGSKPLECSINRYRYIVKIMSEYIEWWGGEDE